METATLLASDVYRFFGVPIAIRSNVPSALEHIRSMYSRFLEGQALEDLPKAMPVIDVLEDDRDPHAGRIEGRRDWSYQGFGANGQAYFDRFGWATLGPDLAGRADPLALVQTVLPDALARLLADTGLRLFRVSAVSRENLGILIAAKHGTARTTLVVKLLERGCRFLADQIACLDIDRCTVVPFPTAITVCDDTRRALDLPDEVVRTPRWSSDGQRQWSFDAEDLGFECESAECVPTALVYLRGCADEPRLMPRPAAHALLDLVPCLLGAKEDTAPLPYKLVPFFAGLRCCDLVAGRADDTADLVLSLVSEGAQLHAA